MPRFDTADMETKQIVGTNYSFSAVRLDKLAATEYTLAQIVIDKSGSVMRYKAELERCIAEIVKACKYSKRADYLMHRVIAFNDRIEEIHGFKLLSECNPDDYIGSITPRGNTALYDSTYNAIESANSYAGDLTKNDFSVNGITFIVTDGCDNCSSFTPAMVKEALERSVQGEVMESMVSVLIGVGDDANIISELDKFKTQANITQFVAIGDANEKKLARLADFVSKSISSQSQSLGSGAGSTALSF